MMPIKSPKDHFLYEMSMIYDGEKKIVEILGEFAGQIQDQRLSEMLRMHQMETQQQIKNLDQCFQMMGMSPQPITCMAIEGIRRDYMDFGRQQPSPEVMTMFVLGTAMKIEHYEIATYRALVDAAMFMGEMQCAQMLRTNLVEEEETAGKLERLSHQMGQRVLAAA